MKRFPRDPIPDRRVVVTALGLTQILNWGCTFYLLAVLATPIVIETGWRYEWVMGGVSIGLLTAGLVSPRVGRAIAMHGPRPVLAIGASVLAAGFFLLGTAQNLASYVIAWIVIGAAMGAGLYDAAFAALGSIYGSEARKPISWVTLFGGFASTVCWPFSAFLTEQLGWRSACFVYAAIQLGFALPMLLFALPRRGAVKPAAGAGRASAAPVRLRPDELPIFILLATVLTISAAILAAMGAHMLTLLQAAGLALSEAVALGMIIGPAAVGARSIETIFGSRYHPIWTMIASATLVAIGMVLFFVGPALFALAIALYAAGNGIGSIAKGTLPLALFGPERYAVITGRLGLPILAAMALAPFVGAVVYERGGAGATFALVTGLAGLNVLLVLLLRHWSRRHSPHPPMV